MQAVGQNESNIKKLKIIINNNFINFIFGKIKFSLFLCFKRLYKINYFSSTYIYIYIYIYIYFKLFFTPILLFFLLKTIIY